jgi:Biotin-requiring enzyme
MRRISSGRRSRKPKASSAPHNGWSAMAEFRVPALGADMEAGVLVAWRRKPGERLERGDVIGEVETDKGIIGS